MIDAYIRKFSDKLFVKKIVKDTVPERVYNIVLPYLGPLADKIKRRVKNVFQRFLPAGKINIIFKTQRKLSHFLKFKDVILLTLVRILFIILSGKLPSWLRR